MMANAGAVPSLSLKVLAAHVRARTTPYDTYSYSSILSKEEDPDGTEPKFHEDAAELSELWRELQVGPMGDSNYAYAENTKSNEKDEVRPDVFFAFGEDSQGGKRVRKSHL